MSDDHARQAMSIYGHPIGKIAPTPHIDRIGHEGAVFQNNYCCNSISGPSRAAILLVSIVIRMVYEEWK